MLITENFNREWPAVEGRLLADLRFRGVEPETARDLGQDVALRALTSGVSFEDGGDLLRWALVVGRRLAIDHHRRHGRVHIGDVPEEPEPHRTEDVVADRLQLGLLANALERLTDDERALLFHNDSAPSRQERVHLAVRRHRLRQRLLAMISGIVAWLGSVRGLRRVARSGAVALVATPIVLSLALLPQLSPSDSTRDVPPSATEHRPEEPASRADHAPSAEADDVLVETAPPEIDVPEPLAPLHGADVEWPEETEAGGVRVREDREDDRVLCVRDNPIVGTVCTPP